jgi:hypothetical protein
VKSPTQYEPSIFQGHVAEIEAFGKSPNKRVHRLFGIRHFADPGDKRSGTHHIAKSRGEITTILPSIICAQVKSFEYIYRLGKIFDDLNANLNSMEGNSSSRNDR